MLIAWRRLLGPWCDVVRSVATDCEALEAAAQLRPDVIVLDLHLGGRSGVDVCRAIKATAPWVDVVLVSAAMDAELEQAARDAGASSFVSKSSVPELERAVRRAFSEHVL
jgi:CheY-like chemotaxis protein